MLDRRDRERLRLLRAKLEQQRLPGSSYLLSFLPLPGTVAVLWGQSHFDGIVAAILLYGVALLLLRSTRLSARLSAWSIDYNYWSLQGSLAVRYRFDIFRTLSLRPPTNLADKRRLWQAARAVTVLARSWPPGRPDGQHGPGAARTARTARTAGRDGPVGNLSLSGLEAL